MKTRSCKAKGRRLCIEIKAALERYHPDWAPQDLKVTISGEQGRDLQTFGQWKDLGLAIECKNRETLNVWEALGQAESHAEGTSDVPCVVFRRNRSETYVALKFEDFLKLTS